MVPEHIKTTYGPDVFKTLRGLNVLPMFSILWENI
jgi:hypothetical protein